MRPFSKFAFIFCGAIIILSSACSSDKHVSATEAPAPPPNQNSQDPPVSTDPPKNKKSVSFKEFGIIREFGGTDNSALFGLLPNAGKFEITQIVGPGFLKEYKVGELKRTTVDKLFLNSAKPMSQNGKDRLLSDFNGATIIYIEGYNGNLCTQNETEYEIKTTGKIDGMDIEVSLRFEAIPNANGNCTFHTFGIVTRYVN